MRDRAGRGGIAARARPRIAQLLCRHHQPLKPGEGGGQIVPRKLQLAAIMRLQAHQAVGQGVEPPVDQRLQA